MACKGNKTIAHHEPICFHTGFASITTSYIEFIYTKIITLFYWIGIDAKDYLFGLDHIQEISNGIQKLERSVRYHSHKDDIQ